MSGSDSYWKFLKANAAKNEPIARRWRIYLYQTIRNRRQSQDTLFSRVCHVAKLAITFMQITISWVIRSCNGWPGVPWIAERCTLTPGTPGGGTLGISGWGCAAGTLTRATIAAKSRLVIVELYHASPIPPNQCWIISRFFHQKGKKSTWLSTLKVGGGETLLRVPTFLSRIAVQLNFATLY